MLDCWTEGSFDSTIQVSVQVCVQTQAADPLVSPRKETEPGRDPNVTRTEARTETARLIVCLMCFCCILTKNQLSFRRSMMCTNTILTKVGIWKALV